MHHVPCLLDVHALLLGRRNGLGRFEDGKTKEIYEGKWVAGHRNGRGLCAYPAGHRYEGHW